MHRYFAYGSNLDLDDLARWACRSGRPAPQLLFEGRAWLPDHALCFHYRSPSRGGGALDVAPLRGAAVAGALFRVASFEPIDAKEGVREGRYARVERWVVDEDGVLRSAVTYRVTAAHRRDHHVPPTPAYVETVRRGMRRWGIDPIELERATVGAAPRPWPSQVFVYGTLKRGHCRALVMERANPTRVEEARARGRLVDLGDYPGLVLDGDGLVHGELWVYEDVAPLLAELDAIEDFEGYGRLDASLYARTLLRVEGPAGPQLAWTYVWRGEAAPTIASGRWTGA